MSRSSKDGDYYPYPGFVNPNVYYRMYWKDARNVLEDLYQFDYLYIKYHGCVWSPYTDPSLSNEKNSDDRKNAENDYWYMGSPSVFKANVAYSLYGVLKNGKDKGCSKSTYINSFFTTGGLETIADSLQVDTSDANSYCSYEDRAGYYGYGNNDDDGNDDKYGDDGDDKYKNDRESYVSVGTGCTINGEFVLDKYIGTQCDGSQYLKTTDTLDQFNAEMDNLNCERIYDGTELFDDQDDFFDDGQGDDQDDDGRQQQQQQDDASASQTAYYVLSNSQACSRSRHYRKCPDPHGLLRSYEHNLQKAKDLASQGVRWELQRDGTKGASAGPILGAGLALLLYSAFLLAWTERDRLRSLFRRRGKTTTKHAAKDDEALSSQQQQQERQEEQPLPQPYNPATIYQTPSWSVFQKHIEPSDSFDIVEQLRQEEEKSPVRKGSFRTID